MKRSIVFILCGAMIISVAGCGRQTTTNTSSSVITGEHTSQAANENISSEISSVPVEETADNEESSTGAASTVPYQTITKDGTYTISGNVDGQILITAQNVTLILDNATIECTDGAGILGYYEGGKQNLTIQLNGTSSITSTASHGIQGKDNLIITGDGTANISSGKDGIHAGDMLTVESGTFEITAKDDGVQCGDSTENTGEINIAGGSFHVNADAKGIKCGGAIVISQGTLNITSQDDSIHSNTDITIQGGTFTLASGDDAVHADNNLVVSGGNINVTQSYEGLEGAAVNISDGIITIVSTDDGINAAGGTDENVSGGPYGTDQFNTSSNVNITISGGVITLYTNSDGIDSNGTLTVTDGTIAIFIGTTRDGDATDVDNGGTIPPALYGTANIPAGTKLAVGDLWSITLDASAASYCLIIPGVVDGQSYNITADGSTLGTVTATTTIQGMMGGGNAGGMGGKGGRR